MSVPAHTLDLDVFAELFDGVAADADPARLPLLLRVEVHSDAAEDVVVGVSDLDGAHPGPALLGFDAPAEWSVLGVASIGWSLPPERFDEADLDRNTFVGARPSEDPDRVRVRSVVLVDRRGRVAGRLTVGDGSTVASAPSSGAMIDVLLRAMGCATAAPGVSTLELFTLLWLADVIGVSTDERRRLTWRRVEALHPAVRLLASAGARRQSDTLEALGRALANVCGWPELRRQTAERGWTGAGCSADEAAWFDDGSFARWAVGTYPPLASLVASIDEYVVPSAARRVRAALGAWSLL